MTPTRSNAPKTARSRPRRAAAPEATFDAAFDARRLTSRRTIHQPIAHSIALRLLFTTRAYLRRGGR